ncbi:MAG: hypothetical protein QGG65_10015, partial [Gammaproteobacteria bacterium]|nr:hypothetical protein [Gammaproteobacteria bacterium]
ADIGWIIVDSGVMSSGDEDDINGFSVGGSIAFGGNWHAKLEYRDIDESGSGGLEFDGYRAAIGLHPALTADTDLVMEVGYFDWDRDDLDDEADGFDVSFGVSSMITDKLELRAIISTQMGEWDDMGGEEDFTDSGLTVGGQWNWNDNASTSVDLTEDEVVKVAYRWNF